MIRQDVKAALRDILILLVTTFLVGWIVSSCTLQKESNGRVVAERYQVSVRYIADDGQVTYRWVAVPDGMYAAPGDSVSLTYEERVPVLEYVKAMLHD